MKKSLTTLGICLTAALLTFSSCKKQAVVTPISASCHIIFNDTIMRTADSIHYDMYNGSTPRIQAFIDGVPVITVWPSSFTTHSQSLSRQYLYWIVQNPAVYTTTDPGTLTLTSTSGMLSGSLTGTGNVWINGSSSTPPASTVSATFSNVKQLGS